MEGVLLVSEDVECTSTTLTYFAAALREGADLVVTPRALDSVIAHGAALLAGSVNRALQPRLTVQQLCWLTG